MQKRENLTIDDIAKALGICKTTVSRAISGKGRISAATREKVQQYIQEHNYHPNAAAKALAESKTYNIAFVISKDFADANPARIWQLIETAAEEIGKEQYTLLLCLITNNDPSPLLRILQYRKVDGIIIAGESNGNELTPVLVNHKIPFVSMHFGQDSEEDGRAIAQKLLYCLKDKTPKDSSVRKTDI